MGHKCVDNYLVDICSTGICADCRFLNYDSYAAHRSTKLVSSTNANEKSVKREYVEEINCGSRTKHWRAFTCQRMSTRNFRNPIRESIKMGLIATIYSYENLPEMNLRQSRQGTSQTAFASSRKGRKKIVTFHKQWLTRIWKSIMVSIYSHPRVCYQTSLWNSSNACGTWVINSRTKCANIKKRYKWLRTIQSTMRW